MTPQAPNPPRPEPGPVHISEPLTTVLDLVIAAVRKKHGIAE